MYLFEFPNSREQEALRRLFSGPHRVCDDFWRHLGIEELGWFGLNIPKRLFREEPDSEDHRGDIDVLVGAGIPDGAGYWRPAVQDLAVRSWGRVLQSNKV
ncbi:MAG: hypothetical protein ACE5JU_21850 [Candidatus Binatia bacterium]